ncbi:hypothetical protein, partial [Sinomicrobium pectinilyticum]|uniref:hypothetical protein n=1 Tax=Sinomicrobium pectinilyticum TaxID=1084421 RepID=UPI0019CFA5EC
SPLQMKRGGPLCGTGSFDQPRLWREYAGICGYTNDPGFQTLPPLLRSGTSLHLKGGAFRYL